MYIEYEELAMVLVGLDYDDENSHELDLDELLIEKYNIESYDAFRKLLDDLMPMIAMGESPLTKKVYKGFGKNGVFLCKIEAD